MEDTNLSWEERKRGEGEYYICHRHRGIAIAAASGVCPNCDRFSDCVAWKFCYVCARDRDCCNMCGIKRDDVKDQ